MQPRRLVVAARDFAHAREQRRERTSPRVRLSLALVILAGAFVANVWREKIVLTIDALTESDVAALYTQGLAAKKRFKKN